MFIMHLLFEYLEDAEDWKERKKVDINPDKTK